MQQDHPHENPRFAEVFAMLVLFVVGFSYLGWPWLREARHALPLDDATEDAWLIFWVLDWVRHALLTAPWSLFDPPINFPATRQLTGSEHFLGAQILYLPLRAVTGDAVLAANLTAFLCYPLAGAAMAWLLRALGLPTAIALAGGFVYAFGSTGTAGRLHVLQLPHFYLPLAALALLRLRRSPTWPRTTVLATVMTCGVLSSYHMAVYLTAMAGIWLLAETWLAPPGERRRFGTRAGGAIGVALALLVVLSVPYLRRPEATEGSAVAVSRWETRHLDTDDRARVDVVSPGQFALRAVTCTLSAGTGTLCGNTTVAWIVVRDLGPVRPYMLVVPLLALLGTLATLRRASPWRRVVCIASLLGLAGFLLGGPDAVRIGPLDIALPARLLESTPARFIRVRSRGLVITFFGATLLVALGLRVAFALRRPWGAILVAASLVIVSVNLGSPLSGPFTPAASRPVSSRFTPRRFLRAAAIDRDRHAYEQVAGIVQAVGPGPLLEWPRHFDRVSAVVGQTIHRQPSLTFYTGYLPLHVPMIDRLAGMLPDPDALDDLVDMTTLRWILVRPEDDWPSPHARDQALKRLARHRRHRATRKIGGFALVELDPRSHRPEWFEALAAGPRPGCSALGAPLGPLPAAPDSMVIGLKQRPRQVIAGRAIALDVEVRNAGPAAWAARLSRRPELPFAVYFESRWIDLKGSGGWMKRYGTAELRRDVPAQETMRQQLLVAAPGEPGRYRLMLRLRQVDGPDTWGPHNSVSLPIEVVAPPKPTSGNA